jgi:putative ABC transport system permease protein
MLMAVHMIDSKTPDMLKNYLLITWRNLVRNKFYSILNIVALSIGMAVFILIGLWVRDERSYNRSFDHYDRIAMVTRQFNYNSIRISLPGSPYTMRDELLTKYPNDFRYVVLSTGIGNHRLVSDNKNYFLNGGFMNAEAADMLSLHMLSGTRAGLAAPTGMLLSSTLAKTLFGNTDPIGKTIQIDEKLNARVTGVYEDIPYNTDFRDQRFIASMDLFMAANPDIRMASHPWYYEDRFTAYAQLTDRADMDKTSQKIRDLRLGKIPSAIYKTDQPVDFLHPMSKWHLYTDFEYYTGYTVREKIEYVRLLGTIAVFVLLLACINFINLSTARADKRAKEIGIRKAIGSLRAQLIGQFLFESLLAVLLAFLFSMQWVALSLPAFNRIAVKALGIPWGAPSFWLFSVLFILVTGLIAGGYPAIYLSSFRPITVLKGSFKAGLMAVLSRRALVVLQFTVSIALIICTMVINRQIHFAFNRPIGYDRAGLVMINMTPDIQKNFRIIGDELKRSRTIIDMAASQNTTIDYNADDTRLNWQGKDPNLQADWAVSSTTYGYGKLIGWQLIAGRDFSPSFPTDSTGLVVNEAAVRQMGFTHPLGRLIEWRGRPFHIIGVIRNIIFESPYTVASSPSIFHIAGNENYVATIKLNPRLGAAAALSNVRAVFARYNPSYPFDYRFVDQEYAKKFSEEEQIGTLSGFFTMLAILISCLGLFGLVSFMAEQRRKEISVRKVLGASTFNLWGLLSKDFARLVIIALVLAAPIAWYLMHNWLQQYEYRYRISWTIFVIAGGSGLLVALLTVSYQAIKAATANPVKSLRSE